LSLTRRKAAIGPHPAFPATRDNAEVRSGYWGQMQAFAQAIQSGKPNVPTLRDAYQAMVVADAILDSIDRRTPIELPDPKNL
jgi:predicted dehydrogenase